MSNNSTTARMQEPMSSAVHVHKALHRELKIAAAHRNQSISSLISEAWDCFKREHGDSVHDPQDSTELAPTG